MKKSKIFLAVLLTFTYLFSVFFCLNAFEKVSPVVAIDDGLKIVVDAGHGGIDGGVSGVKTGIKESDLNLQIALKLGGRLKENGFFVTQTRKTESGLYGTTAKGFKKRDMEKRKEIIEKAKPSFVLSVHQNRFPSASSRGAVVFYKTGDEASKTLALLMQERLNALYEEKGVKGRKCASGEYFILECADCPSVLVECGFLSSPLDEALLLSDGFQEELISAVTSSVVAYLAQAGNAA